MTGTSGERGSGKSVLAARHDDEEDELCFILHVPNVLFVVDYQLFMVYQNLFQNKNIFMCFINKSYTFKRLENQVMSLFNLSINSF